MGRGKAEQSLKSLDECRKLIQETKGALTEKEAAERGELFAQYCALYGGSGANELRWLRAEGLPLSLRGEEKGEEG